MITGTVGQKEETPVRIIDAHLHLFPSGAHTDEMARRVGHENSAAHLRKEYARLDVVHGVVMGNGSPDEQLHSYPPDLFHYCFGFDSRLMAEGGVKPADIPDIVREHLARENCCGVKLYPGYDPTPLTDSVYGPIYEAAARYDKPVAIHTGLTAHPRALLKNCHPLLLDEIAAEHPRTRFVMCHFGNPFFESSAAVLDKNHNVCADLSGLLEGRFDAEDYLAEQSGYVFLLKAWLAASDAWDRIMFGTDWPIINYGEYIDLMRRILPEKRHEAVFFENANRIYGLGLN